MYVLVTKQLITMFLILLAGFIFAKIFNVQEIERKFLSKLLLYFINPCVIINSFNKTFDSGELKKLLFVVAISLFITFVMILIGKITSGNLIDRLGIAFTNCGFMGIPLIRGVFGEKGVFFLMGYLVIFNFMVWTYGYSQFSGGVKIKKIIFNPNIICIFFGIILYCLPVKLPEFIEKPVFMVGELNTAVSMILLGVLLADFKLSEGKKYVWSIVKFCVVRLVICGLVNICILFFVMKFFGNFEDARMLCYVVLICSMCPAATSIPGLACVFNRDSSYASLIVSISSVACIATLPSLVALAELIF